MDNVDIGYCKVILNGFLMIVVCIIMMIVYLIHNELILGICFLMFILSVILFIGSIFNMSIEINKRDDN